MLKNAKLVAFCATARPDESRQFYQSVIGLTLLENSPFALVFDSNGTELRIQKVASVAPGAGTALGWSVVNIEAHIRELAGHGVLCEKFPGMQQDELGIWATPDGAKVAWFRDPDGNMLSLTEYVSA